MDGTIGPLKRLFLAFVAFFYVLADRRFAEDVEKARQRRASSPEDGPAHPPPGRTALRGPESAASPAEPKAPTLAGGASRPPPTAAPGRPTPARHAEALLVLALLQREGRLIDFASESLEGFSDSDIGAAARTVHAGCRRVLETYLKLEPIYREAEGATVTVAEGFDPSTVRLTGNVVGSPPFRGSLRHHGWRAAGTSFPEPAGLDPRVLSPAEVEL